MILIRHGQSEFNLHFSATRSRSRDPRPEAHPARSSGRPKPRPSCSATSGITRIIASPYTRAMQTAAPFARRLGLPVTISPLVRERYHFVCDVGSPVSALRDAWPEHDFGDLPGGLVARRDRKRDGGARPRGRRSMPIMAAQPDHAETLVVTHWAFIRAMTGQSLDNGEWIVVEPQRPRD